MTLRQLVARAARPDVRPEAALAGDHLACPECGARQWRVVTLQGDLLGYCQRCGAVAALQVQTRVG